MFYMFSDQNGIKLQINDRRKIGNHKDEEIKQHISQNQCVRGVKRKIKIYFEMNRNRSTKCQ